MGKFISRTITIEVVLCGICFVTCNFYNATNIEDTPTNKINQNNNMLSMMLETDSGSGQYEMTSLSSWPTEGYVFNSELSKCENGSKLSWDETNKQVVFSGNITDKCNVYFDVIPPVYLNDYIISQYTGTQGENGLYYHDSTLTNGENDNSYRYAGSRYDINGYICLGSSEETCPKKNLYKIIGIFGEDNHGITGQQLVKVKASSFDSHKWNSVTTNNWSTSSLNTTFKANRLSGFEDKIAEVTWKVSGISTNEATAKTVYTEEITNATKTYQAKIGLMYASDYGFATLPAYWTTILSKYDYDISRVNWLFYGSGEWLLSPRSTDNVWVFSVELKSVTIVSPTSENQAFPSFYLTSSVQYSSGSGTSTDPIRIK